MANTTWSPTDHTAGITLSNGNLTVTAASAGAIGGRATDRQINSGKYYFEITGNTLNNNSTCFGLARGDANMATAQTNNGIGCAVIFKASSNVYINAVSVGSIGTSLVTGAIICIALDLDHNRLWFRNGAAGNWNNNASNNPATNTGGFDLSTLLGAVAYYPAYSLGNTSEQLTANFGDSAFTGAVPSGFVSGFPVSSPPLQVADTQTALEQWVNVNARAQLTQLAIEQWGLSGAVGTQAIATQVALEEWAPSVIRAPVELSGNIGGLDKYGKLAYGLKPYSWSAIQPAFAASALGIVPAPIELVGGLAPVISFAASAGVVLGVGGNLAPAVSFSAYLSGAVDLAGNLAPQVALGGSLTAIMPIGGDMTPDVVLAASGLLSGPLWAESAPCPPPMWAEAELCPDPGWIPLTAPGDLVYQGSAYGLGGYGANRYGLGTYVPAGPSPWSPAELCNG